MSKVQKGSEKTEIQEQEPSAVKSFHELATDLRGMQERLAQEDELTNEQIEEVMRLSENLEAKAEGCIAMLDNFRLSVKSYKAIEKRFKEKRQSCENAYQRLRDYCTFVMEQLGRTVIETDLGKMRHYTHHTASVEVLVEPEDLPERFQKVRVYADTTALREALESDDPEAQKVAKMLPPSTYIKIH